MSFLKFSGEASEHYPIYTTRKSADGTTMTWNIDGRSAMRILLLVVAAVQLWLVLAIVAGIGVVGFALFKLLALLVGLL